MFFSFHGIFGLVISFLIFLIGFHSLGLYRKEKTNYLFLAHSVMYFAGGIALLLAIIPSFLHSPNLLRFFLGFGLLPLALMGIPFLGYAITTSVSSLERFSKAVLVGLIIFGILIVISIFISPPTISFVKGWTIYIFPAWIRISFLIFFATSMAVLGIAFLLKIREVRKRLKEKSILLSSGYFLLAVGIILALMGEKILYNFLLLVGYILIYISSQISEKEKLKKA